MSFILYSGHDLTLQEVYVLPVSMLMIINPHEVTYWGKKFSAYLVIYRHHHQDFLNWKS